VGWSRANTGWDYDSLKEEAEPRGYDIVSFMFYLHVDTWRYVGWVCQSGSSV